MKITNPDWHPGAYSQLTVAQQNNLQLLLVGPVTPKNFRQKKSLDSMVRHGLAVLQGTAYVASDLAREWQRRGYVH